MLLGYLLGSKMFTLVINRIRSGNYTLSGVENQGILAWLHNKRQQKSDQSIQKQGHLELTLVFFFFPCATPVICVRDGRDDGTYVLGVLCIFSPCPVPNKIDYYISHQV